MGGFNITTNIDLDIVQSPLEYASFFLTFAFGVVCDMQDLYSQIPYQISILFFFRPLFSRLGQTYYFIWGPYAAENGIVFI
jgi:hypothetical protein